MQKNGIPGRRKGCPNYSPEFKQQLVAGSCDPGISISKLALENGINANQLFKWREGKLLLPSSESPQLLPVTLDAVQPELSAKDPEALSMSCEITFRRGTLRLNGTVSEKLLTLLIQELKRCSRYQQAPKPSWSRCTLTVKLAELNAKLAVESGGNAEPRVGKAGCIVNLRGDNFVDTYRLSLT